MPAGLDDGDDSAITKQVAVLTSYIDQNVRFETADPEMAKLVETWRAQRRELQAKRHRAKPREQRLRELASDIAAATKVIARKREVGEAARLAAEAAKAPRVGLQARGAQGVEAP